jgi:ketosteroid isomerase-like protein
MILAVVDAPRMARLNATRTEIVGDAVSAYNRRDVVALKACMAPDVDLRPPVSTLHGRAYLGHAGVEEWLHDVEESFDEATIEVEEFRELPACVLALATFRVRGRESRLELRSELGLLCELTDGLITRWHGYFDHAEAERACRREERPWSR